MEVYEKTIRISRGLLGFIDLRELLHFVPIDGAFPDSLELAEGTF